MGFPGGSDGKESACNVGDLGSIPGLGRSPGEGIGNPLQYSCLENSMDRGDGKATGHGVAESRTEKLHFHSLSCITLPSKVHMVKALGFPVIVYGCESWTIKRVRLSTEEFVLLNCDAGEDS